MATLRVLPGEVAWLPWSAEAFARARDERKPILLSITTAWSDSCREMDRTSYADPAVAFLINDRFVPIRVDADRRPDISERYSLGGWPTTAFLTPDGEVFGGGTFVEQARMARVLESVRVAFEQNRGDFPEGQSARLRVPDAGGTELSAPPEPARLCADVFDLFDEEHGGFGTEPKFPHTAPLHLALALHRTSPDDRLVHIVTRTLDALGWGPLYDEINGGFFRYASSRDWQAPHREKVLDVNAALISAFVDASQTLGIARFAERAADTLHYLHDALADTQDGGWFGSQSGDGTVVDRVFFADANAATASASLAAAAAFADEWLRDFALKSLERVLLACYRPGQGVAHYFDGGARVGGLLADQIAMAGTQLDAFEVTGNVVYEMMAEELAHYAIREMWDEAGGGFFDRATEDDAGTLGLMRVRLKPFVTNCDAARMLKRLAAVSGESDFARRAEETLSAMAPSASNQGPLAAHYLLAAL